MPAGTSTKFIRPHLNLRTPTGRGATSGSAREWKYAEIPQGEKWFYLEAVAVGEQPAPRRGLVFVTFKDLLDYLSRTKSFGEQLFVFLPKKRHYGEPGNRFMEIESAYELPGDQGYLFLSTDRHVVSESEVTVLEKHASGLRRVYPQA